MHNQWLTRSDVLDFFDPTFPERRPRGQGIFGFCAAMPYEVEAVRSIQLELILYLEEWIDSGLQPDGSERPFERNFRPKCRGAEFVMADDANLAPPPNALVSIAKMFDGQLYVNTRRTGENFYSIRLGRPPASITSLSINIHPGGGYDFDAVPSLSDNREVIAGFFFYLFYGSEWVYRLVKCRHCGAFALPTRKLWKSYTRGWLCKACSRTLPAILSVTKARADARRRWFALAVEAWRTWEAKPQTGDRNKWITREVNRGLPPRDARIRSNTIKLNEKKIEQEVKRIQHATA